MEIDESLRGSLLKSVEVNGSQRKSVEGDMEARESQWKQVKEMEVNRSQWQ